MRFLRKNTAVIITVGPFYDKTDGVTIETGLTITNERITLTADTDDGSAPTNILDNVTGAASGTDNDLNYITNNDAGMMQLELSQANTNRVGRMLLSITDAANHVPVFHEFMVLDGAVYDSLVLGTDKLAVDAQEISSDGTAADNAESFFDGTGYAGTNNVIPLVTTTTTATTTTNLTNLPAAAATAAELAKVPKSDSNVTWNATALASINAEVDGALNTAIPGSPTADSINERVATMDGLILGTLDTGTHKAQSGDSYPVVSHVDYGNAKLVRSTTPANTLDVAATGEAGLDFANIKVATSPTTLTNITVPIVTTTGTASAVTAISTGGIVAGSFAAGAIDAAAIADNAIDNATFAADVGSTAYATNKIGLAADKAVVNASLATAASIAALNNLSAAQVNAEVVDVLRTDTIPDSVAADAAQPTIAQALYEILQFLTEKSVTSTTLTVKKPDGSTSLMTFTLDSATAPTSITRAT